jgi:hypothetical protein
MKFFLKKSLLKILMRVMQDDPRQTSCELWNKYKASMFNAGKIRFSGIFVRPICFFFENGI